METRTSTASAQPLQTRKTQKTQSPRPLTTTSCRRALRSSTTSRRTASPGTAARFRERLRGLYLYLAGVILFARVSPFSLAAQGRFVYGGGMSVDGCHGWLVGGQAIRYAVTPFPELFFVQRVRCREAWSGPGAACESAWELSAHGLTGSLEGTFKALELAEPLLPCNT